MSNVFDEVINKGICSYCGACISVCPKEALSQDTDNPAFSSEKCINCSLCLKVCPHVTKEFYEQKFLEAYIARSLIEEISAYAQSGGIVSTIIKYMLDTGQIDVVLTCSVDENLKPIPYILTTSEEIYKIAGSKYSFCPVLALLRECVKQYERIMVVGLPCQMIALHKISLINKEVREKVKFKIGLLCFNNFTYTSLLNVVTKEFKLEPSWVGKIDIRGGKFMIYLKGGIKTSIALSQIEKYFAKACRNCRNFIPPYVDIAVGTVGAPEGYCLVLAFSKEGLEILMKLMQEEWIEIRGADKSALRSLNKLVRLKRQR